MLLTTHPSSSSSKAAAERISRREAGQALSTTTQTWTSSLNTVGVQGTSKEERPFQRTSRAKLDIHFSGIIQRSDPENPSNIASWVRSFELISSTCPLQNIFSSSTELPACHRLFLIYLVSKTDIGFR